MTVYTLYMQKPQTAGAPFAAPVSAAITIDDAAWQNDPPAVGNNLSFPAGAPGKLLYIQSFLAAMQTGFEFDSPWNQRGIRWTASSDGGATFVTPRDQ